MFNSGYLAENLINEIENEINSNFPVSKETYVAAINETEQLIYSEIIKEQRTSKLPYASETDINSIPYDEYTEDIPRTTDIYSVFLVKKNKGCIELEKTTPERVAKGIQDNYSYTFDGEVLKFFVDGATGSDTLMFIRLARPILKRVVGDRAVGTIALPIEFTELIRCKLRTETYRLLNDDALCAKWADRYNYHLENFKQFIETRRASV